MAQVQCVECGRAFSHRRERCPACGHAESVPFRSSRAKAHQAPLARRGALYMVLAGVFWYFAGQQEGLTIPDVVVDGLLPLFFLSALGLFVYGLIQR